MVSYSPTREAELLIASLSNPGDEKMMRKVVFSLLKCLKESHFSHEFKRLNGIEYLLNLISLASGNTLAYALNCLQLIETFDCSDEFVQLVRFVCILFVKLNNF